MITRVKGTLDILNAAAYDTIISEITRELKKAKFTHIETPLIEQHALFTHAVGTETDIVSKEMYVFSPSEGETLCLRPEATASTMRAYLQNTITEKPWRVYTYGPMFRHERPQKGRYRQFSQFNIESINIAPTPGTESAFISMLDMLFSHTFNLTDYVLALNYLGTREERANHRDALAAFVDLHRATLCETCLVRAAKNILRIFDCKNETCHALYQTAPKITDYLAAESARDWAETQRLLTLLGVNFYHNPFLVRGLDYYSRTVFEFSSPLLGAQSAFCGGGFYDLSSQFDVKNEIPSIGAAIGIERFLLLLEEAKALPMIPPAPFISVTPLSSDETPLALLTLHTLWRRGFTAELVEEKSLTKALKRANTHGAALVILIGPDERAIESVMIKNMKTGETSIVPHEHIIQSVTAALG